MPDDCLLKSLPDEFLIGAADLAVEINPLNAPNLVPSGVMADEMVLGPQRIAALTSRYWKAQPTKISVSFMEKTADDLRAKIIGHMNAWNKTAIIAFVPAAADKLGAVRITRNGGGYWSYLGTDILSIPRNQPTMSLEGFSMQTPDEEYTRVVRHEAGHTLGFPHEHMRRQLVELLDRAKTYAYFKRTSGWGRSTVDAQVFTPLDERSLLSTPPDENSIMCYRFPGSITKDGDPINGGGDINESDYAFAGRIYPRPRPADEFDTI